MRNGKYDLALIFDKDMTIGRLAKVLEHLGDEGINIYYNELEFYEDGLFARACTNREDVDEFIKSVDGVELDWDTMAEWFDYEEQEEEE